MELMGKPILCGLVFVVGSTVLLKNSNFSLKELAFNCLTAPLDYSFPIDLCSCFQLHFYRNDGLGPDDWRLPTKSSLKLNDGLRTTFLLSSHLSALNWSFAC